MVRSLAVISPFNLGSGTGPGGSRTTRSPALEVFPTSSAASRAARRFGLVQMREDWSEGENTCFLAQRSTIKVSFENPWYFRRSHRRFEAGPAVGDSAEVVGEIREREHVLGLPAQLVDFLN